MNKNHSIEWKVIMSHLKGCATPEEEEQLRNWLEAEPTREQYLVAARQAWQDEIASVGEDYEATFQELMTRIGDTRKRQLKRLWSYAAAACVLIGLFAGYHFFYPESSRQTVPENTLLSDHIHPGSSKAILILNNGQEIALGDSILQINLNGVEVKNDSTNTLQYHADHPENHEHHNQLLVPRGGEYCVTLSDGTTVWLNSESELRYPTVFSGDTRRVELRGEAYFKVAHNEQQPFIVDADGCRVEVLGTEFNLCAYPDDTEKTTTLRRGKVKIGTDRFSAPDTLYPDMQLTYDTQSQKKQIRQVNAEIYGSWRKGHFEFDHTSFEQFLKIVSRWYDFDYQVKDSTLLDYHFTGSFDKSDNIDDMFRILKSSKIPVTISYQDNQVIFDRKQH
ncbi:MAG: FecR domain-containing protein [Odoribacter sp.]|nr:FecR domain-containing protein [Odoribacter sp.]